MKLCVSILLLLWMGSPLVFADLVIRGSDTLGAKMVPKLAEAYRKSHLSIKFKISAEGSNACFKNLLEGSCDIGMASRPVSKRELELFKAKKLVLREHILAHDLIAVIVNDRLPVRNLSLKQVEQIFSGNVRAWDRYGGNGPITAFTRNSSSGMYRTFQKLGMNGRDYGKNIQKPEGGESLRSEVSKKENAIGYCSLVYAQNKGVRAVSIDGKEPSSKLVYEYPLSRHLYFYTAGNMTPEVEKFIEWVQGSKEARRVIEQVGFIPLQPQNKKTE